MKQTFTRKLIILCSIVLILTENLQAQPDYDFRNPVLESGTDLTVGAVYRFPDTKPGIDALVTITGISGGLILENIDGGSGFVEAFQPVILIPAFSNGYIDFTIEFVIGGTTTPMLQAEVPATPIDVDGQTYVTGNVYESDEFDMGPGGYVNYDMTGGEIVVMQSGSLVTGTNVAAIDYPGVDTVARQVMFTVVNSNISTFYYRVGGANNSDAVARRLRSVYFKKFWFNSALMASGKLLKFSGVAHDANVMLNWELSANSSLVSVSVERSNDSRKFEKIAELQVVNNSMPVKQHYGDYSISGNTNSYRLKMLSVNGTVQYSNVMVFNNKKSTGKGFKVYPNIIQSEANISLVADKKQKVTIDLYDFSGRMIKHENVNIEQGTNNIKMNDLDRLVRGSYVLVLNIGAERYGQQIIKR